MKPAPLKETRLLLNLYPVNSVRLNRIEHLLKMEGKTRTWWINAAVREKLDRDHPETNCPEEDYKPAPIPLDNPAAIAAQAHSLRVVEHMTKILTSFTPAAPLDGIKSPDVSGMGMIRTCDALNEKWQTLNGQEKEVILDAAEKMADLPSNGPLILKVMDLPTPAPVKQLESAPPVASDADFWGDDEYSKVRALVKRHTR